VGLVQREIEAAGISTIVLSSIPDLTTSVSVPRLAAIEYPLGRPFGRPGDVWGQLAVLRATLQALEEADGPGYVKNLSFRWPEPPRQARSEPPEPPPIVGHLTRHIWQLPRLLSRNVPEKA
jgi:D-proline reductase (dithiol) PrdB